jgi:hypothetical protein
MLALLLIGFASPNATVAREADTLSANYYLPGCQVAIEPPSTFIGPDAFRAGMCMGKVETLFELAGPRGPIRACPPRTSTVAQALRVVVRYINQRPGLMQLSFTDLAMEAMADAWPCRD